MGAVLRVREPRTGMRTDHPTWAHWRAGWARRSLRARVQACPWCWCFGAREVSPEGEVVEVPCLSCGRTGS